jgi:hypothetical protein
MQVNKRSWTTNRSARLITATVEISRGVRLIIAPAKPNRGARLITAIAKPNRMARFIVATADLSAERPPFVRSQTCRALSSSIQMVKVAPCMVRATLAVALRAINTSHFKSRDGGPRPFRRGKGRLGRLRGALEVAPSVKSRDSGPHPFRRGKGRLGRLRGALEVAPSGTLKSDVLTLEVAPQVVALPKLKIHLHNHAPLLVQSNPDHQPTLAGRRSHLPYC